MENKLAQLVLEGKPFVLERDLVLLSMSMRGDGEEDRMSIGWGKKLSQTLFVCFLFFFLLQVIWASKDQKVSSIFSSACVL